MVWAVGHEGVIVHSEDGGQTWVRQRVAPFDKNSIDLTNGAPLLDVLFLGRRPSAIAEAAHRFRFFGREAVSFLLVLPIALAFPEGFAVVALVVVLGMAIEIVGLGIYGLVVPSVTAQSRSVLTPE